MSMERREENLFREWKRKYGEQFIADGVVNEAAFDASPLPRLVFVLKEVDDCAPGFDLRSFIEAGSPKNGGHTFAPMARWVSAVRGREINFAPEEERKRILLPVAVMNLKKTTGGAITRYGALHAAVMADREFLKEQIRLYLDKPTCFACCGNQVFDLFCDVMGGLPVENCSGTDYCRLDGRCLAFRFYHPNAKIGGLASCFKAAVEKLNRLQA